MRHRRIRNWPIRFRARDSPTRNRGRETGQSADGDMKLVNPPPGVRKLANPPGRTRNWPIRRRRHETGPSPFGNPKLANPLSGEAKLANPPPGAKLADARPEDQKLANPPTEARNWPIRCRGSETGRSAVEDPKLADPPSGEATTGRSGVSLRADGGTGRTARPYPGALPGTRYSRRVLRAPAGRRLSSRPAATIGPK